MRLPLALFLLIKIVSSKSEECGENSLQEHTFGACDEITKDKRVIYSKTCINEYDNRNYTLGWQGDEDISCIRVNTNGKVVIVSGGIGQKLAVVLVESTKGEELEWESDIFVK